MDTTTDEVYHAMRGTNRVPWDTRHRTVLYILLALEREAFASNFP